MRKVMLLAAMLAMVLAAAVPAFAQDQDVDVVGDENAVTTEGDDLQYDVNCVGIFGSQFTGGDASATGGDATAIGGDEESIATAEAGDIAQETGVSVGDVNTCITLADEDGDGVVTIVEAKKFGVVVTTVTATASPAAVQYKKTVTATATASPAAVLPETGGASLLALGAGALLVAGGLVARRIVR